MSFTQTLSPVPVNVGALVRQGWRINRPLTLFGLLAVVTLLAALVGIVADPRAANAAPGWVKPAKFAVSLTIYAATFLWLLSYVRGHARIVQAVATITALTSAVELLIITLQVLRGTYSHFNISTPFDTALFSTMGAAVVLLWLMCLGLGVLLLFQRLPNPIIAWGLRLGVLVAFSGMAVGFLMLGPKDDQLRANAAGRQPALVGAHTVGGSDGGPGLPLVGWSTTHGDLRVAHFIGMHAMQVLPLLALLLAGWRAPWLHEKQRVRLVLIGALGYGGLVGLLTWQALRGQPLVAPDTATLVALAALAGTVAVATGAVLLPTRRASDAQTPAL